MDKSSNYSDLIQGYFSRHSKPLPFIETKIIVFLPKNNETLHGIWKPDNDKVRGQKAEHGYLGTFTANNGLGYHAWKQNDSEFIYWKFEDTKLPLTKQLELFPSAVIEVASTVLPSKLKVDKKLSEAITKDTIKKLGI